MENSTNGIHRFVSTEVSNPSAGPLFVRVDNTAREKLRRI